MSDPAADTSGGAAQEQGGFSFIPRTTARSANAAVPRGFSFLTTHANGAAPAEGTSARTATAPAAPRFTCEQSVARLRARVRLELPPADTAGAASQSSSSAASSAMASPYTPDMVQRLAFLNNTDSGRLLSVLHTDRLKQQQQQQQPAQRASATLGSEARSEAADAPPQADRGASLAQLRLQPFGGRRTTTSQAPPHPFAPSTAPSTAAESETSRLTALRQRSAASPPPLSPISTPGSSFMSYSTAATPPASLLGRPAAARKHLQHARARAPSPPTHVDVTRDYSASQRATANGVPAAAQSSSSSSSSPQYHLLAQVAAARQGLQPPRAVDGSPLVETAGTTAQGFARSTEPPPTYAASTAAPSPLKPATRRTLTRKSAAKKEAAALMRKLRHSAARRHATTLPPVSPLSAEADAVGGAPTSGSNPRDRMLLHRLRHDAAPLPVGEVAPRSGDVAGHDPLHAKSDAAPTYSLFTYPSQYPAALAPRRQTEGATPRPSTLPPSWASAAPFAALASKALPDAVKASLAEAAATAGGGGGGGGGTTHHHSGSDRESPGDAERWRAMTAVSPLYSYPSAMTPATRAAASAAIHASGGAAAAPRKGNVPPSEMECLVFDTCSLLESEPGVMNLVLERYRIGIPFTVLDELDRMHKDRANAAKSDPALAAALERLNPAHDRDWRRRRAHELRNWIAASLGAETCHLLVQKRSEVVEEYDRHASTNDDHILGYAVYLHRYLCAPVRFVTEDKFLRIKANSELGKVYAYADVRRLVGMPPMPVVSPATAQTTAPTAVKGKGKKKGK